MSGANCQNITSMLNAAGSGADRVYPNRPNNITDKVASGYGPVWVYQTTVFTGYTGSL
jgi:hypothetical protein